MFISFALIFFILIGCASASEVNNVSDIENYNDNSDILSSDVDLEKELSSSSSSDDKLSSDVEVEPVLGKTADNVVAAKSTSAKLSVSKQKKASFVLLTPTVINRNYFQVKLVDDNGAPLAKKTVNFQIHGKSFNRTTDSKGIAKLKLICYRGYHTMTYSFSDKDYTPISKTIDFLIVITGKTKLSASGIYAYKGLDNYFTATLTCDNVKLSKKTVRLNFNGRNYYKTTDVNGKVKFNAKVQNGKYVIRYYFAGETNLKSSSGYSPIVGKTGIPTKISKANSIVYYHKTVAPFKVKVLDVRGNPAKGKVVFSIIGKKFTRNLDKNGVASMNIRVKAGSYKMSYTYYPSSSVYKSSSASTTLDIKRVGCNNHGYWVFGVDMKNVNLDKLAKTGTKHILLNYYAVEAHGKAAVETFIKNAKAKGISVHIWMQCFYEGGWICPVNSDGTYKYSYFKSKINEAKKYAQLKGVAGVHLDYLRFPGTAYKHSHGTEAINYFVKELCNAVHKINPSIIVSAALMPEPDSLIHYYGQDVKTISKYLDVLIPMVYKGNYASGTSWIKSITSTFVKLSKGAKVWTGIQGYRSDEDVTILSQSEIMKDCQAALDGGATGVISFRLNVSPIVNFHKL